MPLPIVSVDLMTKLIDSVNSLNLTSISIQIGLGLILKNLEEILPQVLVQLQTPLYEQLTYINEEIGVFKPYLERIANTTEVMFVRMSSWTTGAEHVHTHVDNDPTVSIAGQPELPLNVFVIDPIV